MSYREILGGLATLIALAGYLPYLKDVFAGRTKPHPFTWMVWGLLTAIGFFSQVADNAGPGAWVSGFSSLVCLVIFLAALKNGWKNVSMLDYWSLAGAFFALILWYVTKTPLLSVVLITLVDVCGFIPTIRKTYYKPFEETMSTYVLSGLKYVVAFFALENISLITTLYPSYLILANAFFVTLLVVRRQALSSKP